MKIKAQICDEDLHPHIRMRMLQRGVTKEEIEETLTKGWEANDSKSGTFGKVFVFSYNSYWEGKFYKEKEVRVYYKYIEDKFMLLTVIAKYGENFPKKEEEKCG